MVPVFRNGRLFILGPVIPGKLQKFYNKSGKLDYYEAEELTRADLKRLAAAVHTHNKPFARPKWSRFDEDLPRQGKIVERMDDSDRSGWHRREPAKNRAGYRDSFIPDAGSRGTFSILWSSSPGLSATEVDALHQSTGVPSLAAESVNFAPGP